MKTKRNILKIHEETTTDFSSRLHSRKVIYYCIIIHSSSQLSFNGKQSKPRQSILAHCRTKVELNVFQATERSFCRLLLKF